MSPGRVTRAAGRARAGCGRELRFILGDMGTNPLVLRCLGSRGAAGSRGRGRCPSSIPAARGGIAACQLAGTDFPLPGNAFLGQRDVASAGTSAGLRAGRLRGHSRGEGAASLWPFPGDSLAIPSGMLRSGCLPGPGTAGHKGPATRSPRSNPSSPWRLCRGCSRAPALRATLITFPN